MDSNDRARDNGSGQRRGGGARGGTGNTIKGPHSALTDYLQEIGVSEHFRNRRREQEEALRQQVAQATGQATEAETSAAGTSADVRVIDSADGALAADLQQKEEEKEAEEEAQAGPSTMATRARSQAAAASSTVAVPVKAAGKGKQAKKRNNGKAPDSDYDEADGDADEMNQRGGLNQGSARKGGKMKECEICSNRFLQRADAVDDRLLCPKCRRSLDKSAKESNAVSKKARAAAAKPAGKRKRIKKTEGGLLEYDPGLPTLQDLCVRAIAKNIDQVESFGEISTQSANKVCRIISKMRILDEKTLGLFLGREQTSVTLYDCTKITRAGMQRLVAECPNATSLDLEYCGRLDSQSLLEMGRLQHLASVRLDGAFLIDDPSWAAFFRTMGDRLQSFKIKYTGFGPRAMRALITHCTRLRELRVSECVDFDDDCLAMLAVPVTEHEEFEQEAERAQQRPDAAVAVVWQPLKSLEVLELGHPHKPMSNQTAIRAVQTVGAQLRVLDLTGFKDIADDFVLQALDGNCGRLQELYLGECSSISADALADFFARQRHKRETHQHQEHSGSEGGRRSISGLTRVGLDRCYMLTDRVIQELALYSGATLTWLNLNSVDDNLTLNGLLALAGKIYRADDQKDSEAAKRKGGSRGPVLSEEIAGCVCLEELDLSFVRCTSDSVLSVMLAKCKRLSQISVYGCPDVTAFAPARPGLMYIGRESDTI
ncbi:UV-damaged DNA-binding protein rad7 [Coemansia sp. RSA 1813]|nr:UV-damaged DNA-binding protein rad7 [Coemansia sp. RSA 1646]KAJ1771438.1 UV-damaged DNA-binding protein rad7 [Coemansia sp. RSA 1843]KAJ2089201.1 UV-damaged DNA-binding protein rad7 [Coemansia sp. RSA 986]KAJ2211907.1 UV-damaged DNA-binding protein rad7 [Coemansia sp. RSA 487]KAJ2569237.1 UV-damaged DNA-binding protein rad7 [Coemansia sp. RSA 1813]